MMKRQMLSLLVLVTYSLCAVALPYGTKVDLLLDPYHHEDKLVSLDPILTLAELDLDTFDHQRTRRQTNVGGQVNVQKERG